jgi:4-hydroxy-tetrahydrodipicolinate synthase
LERSLVLWNLERLCFFGTLLGFGTWNALGPLDAFRFRRQTLENETPALRGIFPILATCFDLEGSIDYESQERLIEFCIERGVHGLVTLANASEGHLLSDAEKQELLSFILKQIDGRIPLIAAINHPSSIVAGQAAAFAESAGASAIMSLPPFFGRWRAGPSEIARHFELLDRSVSIPIVLQYRGTPSGAAELSFF